MPKRTDLKTILIIGAGPIIIGQACEFDYSGAQACKALREEGFKVILVNSNPATIMTDPETADVTYIEPITWQVVEKIIEKEKPDAILPTMGGQTALNCALDLHHHGVLDKHGVELIGASPAAIEKAEDRLKFKNAMSSIGLGSARSGIAHSLEEGWSVQKEVGFPVIIRPSFTLGGTGGGIAYNAEEFERWFQRHRCRDRRLRCRRHPRYRRRLLRPCPPQHPSRCCPRRRWPHPGPKRRQRRRLAPRRLAPPALRLGRPHLQHCRYRTAAEHNPRRRQRAPRTQVAMAR